MFSNAQLPFRFLFLIDQKWLRFFPRSPVQITRLDPLSQGTHTRSTRSVRSFSLSGMMNERRMNTKEEEEERGPDNV